MNKIYDKKVRVLSMDGIYMSGIDYTFKLIMLGESSTGKSSLSDRFISGIFNPEIRLTVGVEFFIKTLTVRGKNIKLQIWDLGGENRFRFLLPTYCLGSSGALFLYDITRPDTLNKVSEWTSIVKKKNVGIPILLVGNKIDLKDNRKIPYELGQQISEKNDMAGFFEASAKTGENVEHIFYTLAEKMLDRTLNAIKDRKNYQHS